MKINWIHQKNIDSEQVNQMIATCHKNNQFTNGGQFCQELENWVKDNLHILPEKAVIVCNNGTSAIHAVVSAINLFQGGIGLEEAHATKETRWATQSFTFPASAQGILNQAIIVDIDKEGGLDLALLNPDEVDGIIVTNVFGNLVNIDRYVQWSQKHNKYLVFDNAATPMSFYNGINSCNFGTASTISFHHTKPMGFGEGGAIIVDQKYEAAVRRTLNFGICNKNGLPWDRWGSNYKMSEISAIYILQYLKNNFDLIQTHHARLHSLVTKWLADEVTSADNIKFYPSYSQSGAGNSLLSCFCLISKHFNTGFVNKLVDQGITCRKYYNPLKPTPVASEIYDQIICIPCHLDISDTDLLNILKIIQQYLDHNR